jgi:hypothetical protein
MIAQFGLGGVVAAATADAEGGTLDSPDDSGFGDGDDGEGPGEGEEQPTPPKKRKVKARRRESVDEEVPSVPWLESSLFVGASWFSFLKTPEEGLSDGDGDKISGRLLCGAEFTVKRFLGIRAQGQYSQYAIPRSGSPKTPENSIGTMRGYTASVGPVLYLLGTRALKEKQSSFGLRLTTFVARSRFRYTLDDAGSLPAGTSEGFWLSGIGAGAGLVVRSNDITIAMLDTQATAFRVEEQYEQDPFVPRTQITVTALEVGFPL